MMRPRSYLFVQGNRPDRFLKAASSGAHRIVIDLEDAVGPGDKDAAHHNITDWFAEGGTGIVRINGVGTSWFEADLEMAADLPETVVVVPKADRPTLAHVAAKLLGRPLVALIESVDGLVGIHDLASAPGVSRLAFGNLDFGTDARIPGTGSVLDHARFQIVIASRHANLPPSVDGVTVSLRDETILQSDVERARLLGFTAKPCIHPS